MNLPIQSILTLGSHGIVIDTECQLSNGLPIITIVGLVNKAIDEAKDRIRSSFASAGIAMPKKRITINLAPADIPKESTSLDLAIATAILQAGGLTILRLQTDMVFIGELGLNGDVRAVRGIIGKLLCAKENGLTTCFIPHANLSQATLVPGLQLIPLKTVQELYAGLNGQQTLTVSPSGNADELGSLTQWTGPFMSEVVGQTRAKRALEIAAAGGHNILLNGSPGTGKSMLAQSLPSILPPLTQNEMLEVTHVHSLVSGDYESLITKRPFRAPHHSASYLSIVGGGSQLRPGEMSLAHRGVLFFDELPEFARSTLESLRQPLENRTVTVTRIKNSAEYPANFILVATANPCPCGYYGTPKPCICPPHRVSQYRQKLSGPILDRIDLYIDVEEVVHEQLLTSTTGDHDAAIRARVAQARSIQRTRYTSEKLNAEMTNQDIRTSAKLTDPARDILNKAAKALDLSARSYMRLIKLGRTIADLENSEAIEITHITEALQYRPQRPDLLA